VSGYWELVALARREAELIAAGRIDELAGLHAEWDAVIGALPSAPPEHARAALTETQRLVAASTAALAAALERTGGDLNRLGTGRRAAAAYQAARVA
jgi:hypothetical protein